MSKLNILIRTHSDYDEHEVDLVGVTDQQHVADAFVQIGIFNSYWSHEVQTLEVNVLAGHTDVHVVINDWLDPASNPLCECGHRLMHHRRKNGTGSCKWNMPQHHDPEQRHKCKGFRLAKDNPLPALDKVPQ